MPEPNAIALIPIVALLVLLVASRARAAGRRVGRTQEVRIVVERGYRPSRIVLRAGVPAALIFDRREDDPCSELLVSELWPSAHRLAAHRETTIRFTPLRAGRYVFTCGMGMYSGELVVRGSQVA